MGSWKFSWKGCFKKRRKRTRKRRKKRKKEEEEEEEEARKRKKKTNLSKHQPLNIHTKANSPSQPC